MREYVVVNERFNTSPVDITIHNGEAMRFEATLAVAFIEKWGMVSAIDAGEDSSGRQKLAIMPVDEVVSRACDMAQRAVDQFRERGWTIALPNIEEERARIEREKQERGEKPDDDPPRRRRP